MRRFIGGSVIGLVIGVVIAAKVPQENSQNSENYNKNYADAPNTINNPVKLDLASSYPRTIPFNSIVGPQIIRQLKQVSNGKIILKFRKTGVTNPNQNLFNEVSSGIVEVALSSSQFWVSKSPAFGLFSSVPFGPDMVAYLTWFRQHGGQTFYEKLYLRHNIKSMICGITGPAGAGWFDNEINTIEDLRKSKIAANGLAYSVYKNLGATVIEIVPSELQSALKMKKINAVAFSSPATDHYLGLSKYAKYYYFPGWFQQSRFIDLMFNLKKWQKLSETHKKIIETTCMANITDSIAASESSQFDTLKKIVTEGVDVKKFSPEIIEAIKQSWLSVASSESSSNVDFRQILNSLRKFRKNYSIWRELGKI